MQQMVIQGYRLSPQQKRLWSLQQSGSRAYRASCAVAIDGELDLTVLKKAMLEVVSRHEILRTFIREVKDKLPVQVIDDRAEFSIREHDLSEASDQKQQETINAFLEEAGCELTGADAAPVWQACILTLSPRNRILLLCLPALIADKSTLTNLVAEISLAYADCLSGVKRSALQMQYADVSEVLSDLLESEQMQAGREHWLKRGLGDYRASLLPFKKQPRDGKSFQPRHITSAIDTNLLSGVAGIAQKNKAAVSQILLAAWYVLLSRLSGQAEIVVGVVYEGRSHNGLDEMLGPLEKHLPIRCRLTDEVTFDEIVEQVIQATDEVIEWQDYFDWGQAPSSNNSTLAAYECPFGFEFTNETAGVSLGGVSFSTLWQHAYIDRFEIKLSCALRRGALAVEFHYDSSTHEREQIERLAEQYSALLESIITKAQGRIGELQVMSRRESQSLISDFNRTEAEYPRGATLHELVREQASRTPDDIAGVFDDRQQTYSELDRRSNQLAHHLSTLNVGPEVIVAVCVERSLEMVTGLLGILKAGGAYMPLDPAYPQERLDYMLEDSGATVLLTSEQLAERFTTDRLKLVRLDTDWGMISQQPCGPIDSPAAPENLAYVIYTSGSTGKPKGVQVTHGSVVNFLHSMQREPGISKQDVMLAVTTLSFDIAGLEIWLPLISGARLVMVSREITSDGLRLSERLVESAATVMQATPATWRLLVEAGLQPQPRFKMLCGGEAFTSELAEKLKDNCAQLWNMYGPTETTIWSTIHKVDGEPGPVPLGHPINNTSVYVLDDYLQPVPMGVPGELFIGGSGLARGYLNRPEQIAEKFIPDPLAGKPGARLYRTGDRVCFNDAKRVEFLGRVDYQVKIRGHRVEPGEIEAALVRHPGIKQAVVNAQQDMTGEKRLIAYIVPSQKAAPTTSDLRSFLQDRLPNYMTPSAFMSLEALPLTANGKVDRKALPALSKSRPDLNRAFVAPHSHIEKLFERLWSEVLQIEKIGIHDNFFEMGGDSILAIHIVTRAKKAGVTLTPQQLFQYQTIAQLAEVAADNQPLLADQGLVCGPVALTPIQHQFFNYLLPAPHHWNMPLLLELDRHFSSDLIEEALNNILLHHDALRIRFSLVDGRWQQFNEELTPRLKLSVLELGSLNRQQQDEAIGRHSGMEQTKLKLDEPPLMRATVFRLGPARPDRLLLVIHHLVLDITSQRILVADLQRSIEELEKGETVRLPQKTSSFKTWADHLSRYANSQPVLDQASDWLHLFDSHSAHLPLLASPDLNIESSARSVSASLDPDTTARLLKQVPKAFRSQIHETLVEALGQCICRWAGGSSVLIDVEGHGREEIDPGLDLSRTVGWFTAIYPVLVEAGGTLGERLKRIKEQMRSAQLGGIGYGLLKYLTEDKAVAEKFNKVPEAEISFNYFGQMQQGAASKAIVRAVEGGIGESRSGAGKRRYVIDVEAAVMGGKLVVIWRYSEAVQSQEEMKRELEKYMEEVKRIAEASEQEQGGGYTPADFPLAKLDKQKLDEVLSKVKFEG